MNSFRYILTALLLVAIVGCSSHSTRQVQSHPDADGTLTIREPQVLRLAAGGSGQGTLILHGWQYPFEVNNMTLSGLGPGDIQFEGDVYNLDDVKDFAGTYQVLAAEVQAGQGAQGFWFENENGVRVHIRADGQDITIRLHSGGSTVSLK